MAGWSEVHRSPSFFLVGARIMSLPLLGLGEGGKCFHPACGVLGWKASLHGQTFAAGRSIATLWKMRSGARLWKRAGSKKDTSAFAPDNESIGLTFDRISAVIVRCTNPESSAYPDHGGAVSAFIRRGLKIAQSFSRTCHASGWEPSQSFSWTGETTTAATCPGKGLLYPQREHTNKRKIQAREVEDLCWRIVSLEAEFLRVYDIAMSGQEVDTSILTDAGPIIKSTKLGGYHLRAVAAAVDWFPRRAAGALRPQSRRRCFGWDARRSAGVHGRQARRSAWRAWRRSRTRNRDEELFIHRGAKRIIDTYQRDGGAGDAVLALPRERLAQPVLAVRSTSTRALRRRRPLPPNGMAGCATRPSSRSRTTARLRGITLPARCARSRTRRVGWRT